MNESKIILDVNLINNILKNGGVISFVTDTVWGLGCLPDNKVAVEKIYEIKGRDRTKPLILMSDAFENLKPYVQEFSKKENELVDKYFPGALTIVSKKSEKTPDYITSGKDTVGIRIPDNALFKYLCSVIDGNVLATTSANLSEQPASKSFSQAQNSIGDFVDLVLPDFGFECAGKESTVIYVNGSNVKILRQGSVILPSIC